MRSHKEILDTIVIDKYKVDFDDWFLNVISSDKDKLRMMNDVIDKFGVAIRIQGVKELNKYAELRDQYDKIHIAPNYDEFDSYTNPKKDMGMEMEKFKKTFTNAITHNNGGVAFSVNKNKAFKDVIDVFKNNYRIHDVIKVFPTSTKDDNSSVLIEVKPKGFLLRPEHKYIFIGTEIYSFETDEPIKFFYSMIGNNDVPYPVAVSEQFAYFFLDKVYMKKDVFPKDIDWWDSYKEFYEIRKNRNVDACKMKNIAIIDRIE